VPTIGPVIVTTGTGGSSADICYSARDNSSFTTAAVTQLQNYGVNTNQAYITGYRFRDLNIPAGATITSATIDVRPGGWRNTVNLDIFCEKVQNPSNNWAGGYPNRPMDRALTTAGTNWNTTLTTDAFNTSPNFASALQEVVNLNTSTSVTTLHVLLRSSASAGSFTQSEYAGHNQNGTGTERNPRITITYTTGDATPTGGIVTATVTSPATTGQPTARYEGKTDFDPPLGSFNIYANAPIIGAAGDAIPTVSSSPPKATVTVVGTAPQVISTVTATTPAAATFTISGTASITSIVNPTTNTSPPEASFVIAANPPTITPNDGGGPTGPVGWPTYIFRHRRRRRWC